MYLHIKRVNQQMHNSYANIICFVCHERERFQRDFEIRTELWQQQFDTDLKLSVTNNKLEQTGGISEMWLTWFIILNIQ